MDGFKKFLLRGNVVELAIAFVIGIAFAALVTAFVAAFITPVVAVLTGTAGDFRSKSFTIADADFPYGQFIQALLTFIITAAAVYFFVLKPVQVLMDRYKTEPDVDESVKVCAECLSKIPVSARRCAFCTSEQAA